MLLDTCFCCDKVFDDVGAWWLSLTGIPHWERIFQSFCRCKLNITAANERPLHAAAVPAEEYYFHSRIKHTKNCNEKSTVSELYYKGALYYSRERITLQANRVSALI